MGTAVHCRNTPFGPRYRVWSTFWDAYVCEAMPRDDVIAWLAREGIGTNAPERVERASAAGTSSFVEGPSPLDAPWKMECCRACGRFHREGCG